MGQLIQANFLLSQEIPVAREFERAVINGTRSETGIPGPNYWINHTDYTIDADISISGDTVNISGRALITYHNESPDNLQSIVIRSYPDYFRAGAVRAGYMAPENLLPGVKYSDIYIRGAEEKEIAFNRGRSSTNLVLPLDKPLKGGDSITFSISWSYYIVPGMEIEVSGIYDNGSFFVSYWYPQVAVYDDIYGWDMIDYTGLTEFYNDFNNYDVSLTLPGDYMVWAGGELVNPDDIYPDQILERYQAAKQSDAITGIVGKADYELVYAGDKAKTWKFSSRNSPDFTFGVARNYLWDATSVEMEGGRRVLVSTVYPDYSKHYSEAALWSREAILDFSTRCPAVEYPWPQLTIFNRGQGNSGMESPMMVNNGDQASAINAREVIYHEIAHAWIPFLTGTNERRYAWMDEGWASYKGIKWIEAAPGTVASQAPAIFGMLAGTALDLPLIVSSHLIADPMASTFHTYARSLLVFMVLDDLMGEERMNHFWKSFVSTWSYKHPEPQDMFRMMESSYGSDLSWFLRPWFFSVASPNLSISEVDVKKRTITIMNTGGLPLPVCLTVHYEDGTSEQLVRNASVWKESQTAGLKYSGKARVVKIELGNKYFYESDLSDNNWINPEGGN